ncbi:hypothetical protein V6N13_050423 [Hibiscus sabdariffa]|uniref:DELLA protein n=1 Tax=Hibiscus sabdariffa TaxID=183260 RepID=A0ABR2AX69_9ROSI
MARLREINPALVFILDFYANHNDFNFLTYLKDCFQFYSNLAMLQTSAGQDLYLIRRRKTLTGWKDIFLMAGCRQVPLVYPKDILLQDKA